MPADRLEPINGSMATEMQQKVMAKLGAGRGRIPTPFNIWLHNPALAEGMEIIGTHIDASPILTEAESEVAILSTAVHWNSAYVIANHHRHALKAGVPQAVVEAILAGRRPEGGEGRFGQVCEAVSDIMAGGTMNEARFSACANGLGRATLAELLIIVGYFTAVSLAMTMHALEPKN
jgi:4-carboxymuconolactone decarboxylase